MGRVNRSKMKIIQKRALKDLRSHDQSLKPALGKDDLIFMIHEEMEGLLKTDAFVYLGLEKHKYLRHPTIRPMSHRVKRR